MHFGSEQELVAAETRSRAVLHTVPEPSAELLSEGAIDLRTLIGHRETVRASDNVESVFDTFRRTNVEFLAIIDGDRLLGRGVAGTNAAWKLMALLFVAKMLFPGCARIIIEAN